MRELDGAQFESGAAHNDVTANGSALEFAPASGGTDLGAVTFAIFSFDLSDYSGPSELGLQWASGSPGIGLWIGLANIGTDRWDWQPAPESELLELTNHTDYLRPDGSMLVALIYLGSQPVSLEQIWFGNFPLEAPTAITATATEVAPLGINLAWQPPASGPSPDSYGIWRAENAIGPYIKLTEVTDTSYFDADIQSGGEYWYRVSAQLAGTGHSRFAKAQGVPGSIWHTETVFGPFTDTTIFDPHNDICITENQGHPLMAVGATATDGTYNAVLHVFEAADEFGSSWLPRRDTLGNTFATPQRLTMIGGTLHWLMGGSAGWPGEYWVAQDTAATQWSSPVEHTSQGSNSHMWYLADAGTPLAYSAQAHLDWQIMYQQAPDVQGSSWGVGVPIKQGIKSLKESLSNLVMVGGVPTIFYSKSDHNDHHDGKVMMLRQVDADDWSEGEAFDIDPDPDFRVTHIWAVVIEGEPALFYHHKALNGGEVNELRFTRRSGSSWSSPLKLAQLGNGGAGWQRPMSAAIIDGRPAVACQAAELEPGNAGVIYREAADSLGTAWKDPVMIFQEPAGIGLVTLAAVGSPQRPAIAYARDEYSVGFASRY